MAGQTQDELPAFDTLVSCASSLYFATQI